MPTVELPNGSRVQFPDGTDPATMQTEIEKAFPELRAAPTADLARELAASPIELTETSPVTGQASPEPAAQTTIQPLPATEQAAIQAQVPPGTPVAELGQPATLPRIGEPGTMLRGVSDVAASLGEWALNRPEEALATLTPLAPAIALRYAPEVAIQFTKDAIAGVRGDHEALGRALAMAGLVGGGKALNEARARFQPVTPEAPPVDATATPGTAAPGPGLTGMGAALEGEVAPGSGEDIFGIAQHTREAMAQTGRFPYTPPGEGTSAWEQIQRGRQLMREGANPEAALTDFETTRRISADDIVLIRAHMENLYRDARKIESEHGTDSPEYLSAQQELNDWWTRTKPMQTEWHRIGVAQQGQTDVDTGDLVSLERAHQDATGQGFTPDQTAEATELAQTVRQTRNEATDAQEQVLAEVDKAVGDVAPETPAAAPDASTPAPDTPAPAAAPTLDESRTLFNGASPDAPLTIDQTRALWRHAKDAYINQGETNLDAIAQGVADDFGLPKQTVMEALAGPKAIRRLADDMYLKMSRARQAEAAARAWLINQRTPGWLRMAKRVPNLMFSAKVFGHGTVGMVTHAGTLMFDPVVAREYWTNFARQFRLLGQRYHEAAMQDLMHRPNFIVAKRAGLANDPFRFQDDYQNPQIALALGTFTRAGNRGFDALKLFRQDLFDRSWNSLDASMRTPDSAKLLANAINHGTGVTTGAFLGKLSNAASVAFFAPRLEASRWAFAIKDPAKAFNTFTNWRNASPADRMAAMSELRQKASIAGTYFGLLAANQALLTAFGSKQSVNFTDPHHGDFLAFKAFGRNVSVISPMLHMVGLLADLYRIATAKRGKVESLTPRGEEMGERMWSYGRGKLSPFAQPLVDAATQADFRGRPMPFSSDKVPKYLRAQHIGKWTWPEYLTEQFAPIPAEEAIKEVWEGQGVTRSDAERYLRALETFTVTGATGVRVTDDKTR